MANEPERGWGLLGEVRTNDPSEGPPKLTLGNVLIESRRTLTWLAKWAVVAGVAALVGYGFWGALGACYCAAGVIALRVGGELVLRVIAESL